MVKEGLGYRIRKAREASGLEIQQVAEELHVTKPAVSQWEIGKTVPDVGNLVKLSDLYGVSLDWLLKGEKAEVVEEEAAEEIEEKVVVSEEKKTEVLEKNAGMDVYNAANKKVIEILGISVILVLSCQFPLIGLFVPPIVLLWLIKTKRKYKVLYILCICSLAISLYNTYVIFEHLFFDWGKSTIEEISSLL